MKLVFQYSRAFLFLILLLVATEAFAQECGIVYVTTTGASSGVAGTKANPASLTYGLTLVSPTAERVWLATGTYVINNTLTIPSNVTIEGGFTSGTWIKSNTITTSTIQRTALNPDAANLALVGLTANGASGFRLQDLTITVLNAPGPQYSTYGLRLVGCSNYNVVRCTITPGAAGNGTNGVAGATGATGSNATAGTTGDEDNTSIIGHGGNGGDGGGTGFGAGGIAPALPSGCCVAGAAGNTGVAPSNSRAGGGGGSGANGGQSSNPGGAGGTGNGAMGTNTGGAASPTPGCCNNGASACRPNISGGNGNNGADGIAGATGATGVGAHVAGYWVPGNGINGSDGQGGQGGSGGGGGAGEGITGLCICIAGAGSGGGGGGGGGEGGAGGTGGGGGGSAFAVYLYNNGAGGNFTDCNLATAAFGTGGTGGNGGTGSVGGNGAIGGSYSRTGDSGCGGAGGNGGKGGDGGKGGNGGDGVALPIYQDPGGTLAATNNITSVPGLPPTISVANKGCIDADVTFNATTTGNWNFGAGATPTTGTGTGPITVRYSSLGRKTITFGGTTFTDYIDIFNTPGNSGGFISPGDTTLPVGCFHDFTSDSVGTNYLWIFQGANVDTVTGPTHQTVDSVYFLSPGTYQVTCRVTSANSCCGFLDDTITVTAQSNTINVSLAASTSTICVNSPITYTATPAGYQQYDFYINNTIAQSSTQNTFTTSALQPGDSVTVRAFDGVCYSNPSATLHPTVSVPPSLVLSSSAASSICSGDTVTFSVTPTGLASYSFYNGSTLVQQGALDTYVTDTLASVNSITVIAANGGCPDTSNAIVTTVNQTPVITLSANDSTLCAGTPVTFMVSPAGIATYSFYENGTQVQTSSSNTYTNPSIANGTQVKVVATSASGCVSDTTPAITITVYALPAITLTSSAANDTICSGDNITFTATPTGLSNYTFISNGTVLQTGASNTYSSTALAAGRDTIKTIYTNNGCPDTSNAIVTVVNQTPSITLSANDSTLCAGSPVTFTAAPAGYGNYQFFENGGSVQNGASNTYTNLNIADGTQVTAVATNNGCTSATTPAITITVYALPAITLTSSDPNDTICFGDNITFTATPTGLSNYSFIKGGITLQNSASNTFTTTNLPVGNDTIKVVYNNNGCLDTSNAIVTRVNAIPTINLTANDSSICVGDAITFTATPAGNASYNFMVNSSSAQNSASNTFTPATINNGDVVTATTIANGCPSATSSPVNVTVYQLPVVTLASSDADNIICQGSSITFTASPAGYDTYDFQNGGTSLQATNSNTYTTTTLPIGNSITVIAVNHGCRDTSAAIVTTVTPAPAANAGPDNQLCIYAVSVTIAGMPAGGVWSGNGITPTGTFTAGNAGAGNDTLTYTVTDATSGCTGSDFAVYTVYPLPPANAGNDITICKTDSTILTATGGVSYDWSPNIGLNAITGAQVTATPIITTVYTVTVTDTNSCIAKDSVTVTVAPKPQASFTNNTACAGQPTVFTNTSTGDSYLWNFGDGTATSTDTSTTHTYQAGGLYPVVLVAYEGNCTDTATNNVTVYSNPVSNATVKPTLAVAGEDSVLFNADTTGISNWNWDLGNGDSAHLAQFNYTYQDTGVYSVSLVTVNANGCTDTLVLPDSVHIVAPARIFVPNAFSPNLDGKNDQLWVLGSGVKFFHFWIYDRWGTLVFETRDMTQGWDGTYNGKPAEPGVYVYQLKVDFQNTMQKLYKGSITLLR